MLTAVSAALFAALLLPFKFITVIPGFSSLRIGSSLPPLFALMFGPAGAWGAAIGNLIADIFGGTLSAGSFFGFWGNFLFGYVFYKLWGNLGALSSGVEPDMRENTGRQLLEFWVIAFASSAALGALIGWGLELLGILPFTVIAPTGPLNQFFIPAIITPPLLYLIYPRVKEMGLLFPMVMNPEDIGDVPRRRQVLSAYGILVTSIVWLVVGLAIGISQGGRVPILDANPAAGSGSQTVVIFGAVMLVALLIPVLTAGTRLPDLIRN
jgi:energy-coupling factor transport system substrate-specific component